MEWSNEESLRLIHEYSKHDLLWNPKHRHYFNKMKKTEAWNNIAEMCNTQIEEAKKKMASLLGSFRRERAKGKKIIGTGPDAREVYRTDWFAFKSFAFLMDRNEPRISHNTEMDADSRESKYSTQTDTENIDNFRNRMIIGTIIKDDIDATRSSIGLEYTTEMQEADVFGNFRSDNEISFMEPTTPKRKRTTQQVDVFEDPRLERALQFLQQLEDPTMIYALHLANKLKQFQGKTRTLVEHAINQAIFDAEIAFYNTTEV